MTSGPCEKGNSLMNWHSLLFPAFIAFIYKFVSATISNETDTKTLILKALVYNLPAACKQLNTIGNFNALSIDSYGCLFEGTFDVKRTAIILSLLTQRGNEKLVQDISKIWVSKRKWGPLNQSEIVKELLAVISVKTSLRTGENKSERMKIELKSVYSTLKVLLQAGKELIVGDSIYSPVAAEVFNLAHKVDKADKDFLATASIVLEYFYSIEGNSANGVKSVDNVKLTQAIYATQNLNRLAEKGKINVAAWDVYGPFVCSKLNSIYGTEFAMVERTAEEEKASKNQDSSSGSSSESSDDESEQKPEENANNENGKNDKRASKAKKPIKVIGLSSKSASKAMIQTQASSSAFELSAAFWLIASGSVLLLIIVGFAVNYFISKRREEKEFNEL